MCWSEGASAAMFGVGAVATMVTWRRGDARAIPVTLAYFTLMEGLQVAGYQVLDQCTLTANKAITIASYLHIAFQPLIINAFGMAITGNVTARTRRLVYLLAAIASAILLLRLLPFGWASPCVDGQVLCGPAWCTQSGNWHLGWAVPYYDIWSPILGPWLAAWVQFPAYLAAIFVIPLIYGAWRWALFHAVLGPALSILLTDDPNEMPAVWCLFSIGLVLVSLSPMLRRGLAPAREPRAA
ncbi:DUF5765 domain-containing protein [Sinisalibacter aestuarii]|uniref:Uncharacterized protein n=1 Tax=Sinisalibacter aestuarii TaxID=2949426 RepID=A0ABQ5LU70_9RHOB|nr:DUF5765 domain-containing protein [Sinisalibacter aestuarii]GKY88318.1 hypothetical protein STA1M1_21870 [Sinisalibacter aestuarii]